MRESLDFESVFFQKYLSKISKNDIEKAKPKYLHDIRLQTVIFFSIVKCIERETNLQELNRQGYTLNKESLFQIIWIG